MGRRARGADVDDAPGGALPVPPLELRRLVGPTDPAAFDNPSGGLVYPFVPAEAYRRFFDFGCGCGRVARQLLQQDPRPERYLGIDIHADLVRWANENLAPHGDGFEFRHHDVFHASRNPGGVKALGLPFPAEAASCTCCLAISVFTHLTEQQAVFYLSEVDRILSPDGYFVSSWLLFDNRYYAFHPDLHALYVDYEDPSAAVLFDRAWVERQAGAHGFVVTEVVAPQLRGHQWLLVMRRAATGAVAATWPADEAPFGKAYE